MPSPSTEGRRRSCHRSEVTISHTGGRDRPTNYWSAPQLPTPRIGGGYFLPTASKAAKKKKLLAVATKMKAAVAQSAKAK